MAKIKQNAEENEKIVKLKELTIRRLQSRKKKKKGRRFVFSISYDRKIKEHLAKYTKMKKRLESELKNKIKK